MTLKMENFDTRPALRAYVRAREVLHHYVLSDLAAYQ